MNYLSGKDNLIFGVVFLVIGLLCVLGSIFGKRNSQHRSVWRNFSYERVETPLWWRLGFLANGVANVFYGLAYLWASYHVISRHLENLTSVVYFSLFAGSMGLLLYKRRKEPKVGLATSLYVALGVLVLAAITTIFMVKYVR